MRKRYVRFVARCAAVCCVQSAAENGCLCATRTILRLFHFPLGTNKVKCFVVDILYFVLFNKATTSTVFCTYS